MTSPAELRVSGSPFTRITDRSVNPPIRQKDFATHLLENHYDLRTVQKLLGHTHVTTTQIDTHVLNKPGLSVRSPLDF